MALCVSIFAVHFFLGIYRSLKNRCQRLTVITMLKEIELVNGRILAVKVSKEALCTTFLTSKGSDANKIAFFGTVVNQIISEVT